MNTGRKEVVSSFLPIGRAVIRKENSSKGHFFSAFFLFV